MTDAIRPTTVVAGPGFPRLALGLAWLGATLGTGLLGWLVDGVPGRLLLAAAVLGLAATAAVVSNKRKRATLAFSALAGALFVAVGVGAGIVAAATGVVPAIAMGAVPVLGGLVTVRLSRRARRMAG
jgi:hypothetical protein